jgi:hypothetical protein
MLAVEGDELGCTRGRGKLKRRPTLREAACNPAQTPSFTAPAINTTGTR